MGPLEKELRKLSFYIVRKFLVSRVKNTKSSKFPPKTFKIPHLAKSRGGKRCERCERCSCKDFPTGVKILVKNVIKGGEKMFSPKLYLKNVIKGGVKTAGNHKCL